MDTVGIVSNLKVSEDRKNVELFIQPGRIVDDAFLEDEEADPIKFLVPRAEASNYGLDSKVRIIQKIAKFRSKVPGSDIGVPVFGADRKAIIDPKSGKAFMSRKGKRPDDEKKRLDTEAKKHGGKAASALQAQLAANFRKDNMDK